MQEEEKRMNPKELEAVNRMHLEQEAMRKNQEYIMKFIETSQAEKKKEAEKKTFSKGQIWAFMIGAGLLIFGIIANNFAERYSGMKSAEEVKAIEERIHREYREQSYTKDNSAIVQSVQNLAATVNNNTQAVNSIQATMNTNNRDLNNRLDQMAKKYEELNLAIQKISERVDLLEGKGR